MGVEAAGVPTWWRTLTVDEAQTRGALADCMAMKLRTSGLPAYWCARFASPVWLIGSALRSPTPRDIDVRIVMENDLFFARYRQLGSDWANEEPCQRWVDEGAKLNRVAMHRLHYPTDVQVWPKSYWHFPDDETHMASFGRRLYDVSPHWWLDP